MESRPHFLKPRAEDKELVLEPVLVYKEHKKSRNVEVVKKRLGEDINFKDLSLEEV